MFMYNITQPKAEPSLLISLPNKDDIGEGDTPIFQVKEVERLINANDEIKEKKFFLVSITGVYRSGKSFLLNLMQTYLDHYQKVSNSIFIMLKESHIIECKEAIENLLFN